jgi:hypothetical protein
VLNRCVGFIVTFYLNIVGELDNQFIKERAKTDKKRVTQEIEKNKEYTIPNEFYLFVDFYHPGIILYLPSLCSNFNHFTHLFL